MLRHVRSQALAAARSSLRRLGELSTVDAIGEIKRQQTGATIFTPYIGSAMHSGRREIELQPRETSLPSSTAIIR
jgi:hypothetical protein